jgi:3-oxoacyl-[acyl-carrier-protein] synthase II
MRFVGQPRVAVITAMGLAAPGALDPEGFWKIVRSGQTAISRIKRLDTSESGCTFGGEVPPFDLSLLPAELRPRRVARHTQLLLWAARQIKHDVERLWQRPSIRLGLATSCVSMVAESGVARSKKGGAAASPYAASQSPPHAAAGAIARYLENSGDVLTVSTACAAGLEAVGLAAQDIVSGAADCAMGGSL